MLVLNPDHPFYRNVYRPLVESGKKESDELRQHIDLLLLAAARAEALATTEKDRESLCRQRRAWSDTLATLLNG